MALIENSKPKNVSGGYMRVFGNTKMGALMSKVQSTVISAGTELERLIMSRVQKIDDLDEFLDLEIMPEGVFVAPKRQVIKCKSLNHSVASEPDFVIFKRKGGKQNCYVVELKDGHVFDTKKASAERRTIHNFVERNGHRIHYTISSHICCFNQNDPQAILAGFKKRISIDEIFTGRQFCELLEIDYDEIVKVRNKDGERNIIFFVKELLKIPKIKKYLKKFRNG